MLPQASLLLSALLSAGDLIGHLHPVSRQLQPAFAIMLVPGLLSHL
ncbi:hypothetical protein BF49_3772 [Bradyrhizobium sp.]|nr:hypothetical protein BF49_3772 [Bradyrhizobium sp.]